MNREQVRAELLMFLASCSIQEANLLVRLAGRIEIGRDLLSADPEILEKEEMNRMLDLMVLSSVVDGGRS